MRDLGGVVAHDAAPQDHHFRRSHARDAAQQDAQKVQQAFDADAPEANLQEVVVAMQKASLSFQTMVQVRNRLVTAYQDIMSTQV